MSNALYLDEISLPLAPETRIVHPAVRPTHDVVSPPPLSPTVWSNLPIELVTQILLYAAFASRADAHAFCLVSSAVRRAVLPALYHNVLLRSASQVPAFVSPFTAKQRRPPYCHYPPPTSPRGRNSTSRNDNGFGSSSSNANAKLLAHIPIHALALALPTKRPSLEHRSWAHTRTGSRRTTRASAYADALSSRTTRTNALRRTLPPQCDAFIHIHALRFPWLITCVPPSLTHIALTTRATQPPSIIDEVLAAAKRVLSTCPHLVMLVLSLDATGSTPTPSTITSAAAAAAAANATCTHGGSGTATPSIITLPVPWRAALARQRDPRLYLLPFALHARIMWRDVVAGTEGGGGSGAQDVFACAQAWREAEARGATSVMLLLAAEAALRNAALESWKEDEWDLDLMTAPGYIHGRSADEGETDTPAIQW
ncbi:hypothetical protein BJV77DRAFT_1068020 [Russula vinacea]|nr:hypothetical protein BJV77DRAFT_1068020 [Russula vinacea]